jgi:hypothetical protein
MEALLRRVPREALASAQAAGPPQLMDFLTFAATSPAANPSGAGSTLLGDVQRYGDRAAKLASGLPMCHPDVKAAGKAESDLYMLAAGREEAASWVVLHLRAQAPSSDVVLPLAAVAAANAAFALCHWWVAVALLPGLVLGTGFFSLLWSRQLNPFAPNARGRGAPQSRGSAVVVGALLGVGFAISATRLVPALGGDHPSSCALLLLAFLANGWCFHATVTRDAGAVPLGPPPDGIIPPGASVCHTCGCVRPVRSKHDPFTGRCIRKFDHYCPLVVNAVGEGNQGAFVLFCFTMLLGQTTYLRLSAAYLALHGEALGQVLLTRRLPHGFTACPVVAFNLGVQLLATLFNTFLCLRAAAGIACELTTNEMENAGRYSYLQGGTAREYSNPFDAGLLTNARRFFSATHTDWDALLAAAREQPDKHGPPALSATRVLQLLHRTGLLSAVRRPRLQVGAHGHSHGGVPCDGGHGMHDHGVAGGRQTLAPAGGSEGA